MGEKISYNKHKIVIQYKNAKKKKREKNKYFKETLAQKSILVFCITNIIDLFNLGFFNKKFIIR